MSNRHGPGEDIRRVKTHKTPPPKHIQNSISISCMYGCIQLLLILFPLAYEMYFCCLTVFTVWVVGLAHPDYERRAALSVRARRDRAPAVRGHPFLGSEFLPLQGRLFRGYDRRLERANGARFEPARNADRTPVSKFTLGEAGEDADKDRAHVPAVCRSRCDQRSYDRRSYRAHRGDINKWWGPLQSVCFECHALKSNRLERGPGYSNQIGADGMPVDRAHPFYTGGKFTKYSAK